MTKKFFAAVMLSVIIICFSSCGINPDDGIQNVTAAAKTTVIYNHFKDRIPSYGFDNNPVEKYNDGLDYTLSVKCSEKEYKGYLKKLKKAGFELNPIETDSYYNASDDEGYFVEVTFVSEMLTVYIRKA